MLLATTSLLTLTQDISTQPVVLPTLNKESRLETAKILLIESRKHSKDQSFAASLGRRYKLSLAANGKYALKLVPTTRPDIVVLDAASMRTSGDRICKSIRQQHPQLPLIHIKQAGDTEGASEADVVLLMPFTARKLINRIEQFLANNDGETLKIGPFELNLKSRVLITHKGEYHLTPKMTTLLEAFMRHPNEVLERRYLMVKVWETDYLGDTRTLDVHIRWIREAVEVNPSKPCYIRTVRGVGYLFDLDPKAKRAK